MCCFAGANVKSVQLLNISCFQLRFCSKCLGLRLAARIKEWSLADPHDSIAKAFTQPIVIEGCTMEDTTVIPDS